MWLSTFTTRQGNICIRFGSRALHVQACALAKPMAEILRRHPTVVGLAGVLLPFMVQIYFASRRPKK